MTPTQALDVVLSDAFWDDVLWRDPLEPVYVLSPPGEDHQYGQQGWVRLTKVGALHEYVVDWQEGRAGPNPLIEMLLDDVETEQRSPG